MAEPRFEDALMMHLRALCALGPRPAGSEAEARAAALVRAALAELPRIDIREHSFPAPPSPGWKTLPPLAAAVAGLLTGEGGRFARLLGGVLTLGGAWALNSVHQGRVPMPPLGRAVHSRNIIARIPASGETRHFLTLIAHLDSDRARLTQPLPGGRLTHLVHTAGLGLLFFSGASLLWDALIGRRGVSAIHRLTLAGSALMLAASAVEDLAALPVQGANDDASGVAVLLALAAALAAQPLQHTEVVLLFAGAHETYADGVQSYIDRYAPPRDFSTFIAFDAVGAGDLGWAAHQGLSAFSAARAAPHITALTASTAQRNPELRVTSRSVNMLTPVAPLLRQGYEALCLTAVGDNGLPVRWRRSADALDGIDPDTLTRAAQFGLRLARAVDAKFAHG
jgi:hypothetical protein